MHYNAGDYDLFTYMTNPEVFEVKGGMIPLLQAPGLGISLNEDMIRQEDAKFRAGEVKAWRNPICTLISLLLLITI